MRDCSLQNRANLRRNFHAMKTRCSDPTPSIRTWPQPPPEVADEKVGEAQQAMEDGLTTGKAVFDVNPS
ncbi:hypothetical protein QMY60_05290 [Mycobacteroides abscessus subsp. abscessus]|uniref:hypothetical protein n=2 Tax=Mycobacteroides abscessus TaxID=36809 RepID=UPI0009278AFA|nr:hypothetical protein [Mycobacteroides abscessus]AWG52257.1 hypothetical protein DDT48_24715 [Mycobacteroides abscessus]MBN7551079.1 hypothetical protein [Mycobacteroides abscessus subsp. abscessus]MDO3099783.1 hypothetical protein [Mycobacteroides abscessus subsp. abscessus]MDO3370057.1 hypothetical protein [Mycobacteroides abscessus subsp. abscessus]QSM70507.1 hypothetical protein IN837_05290 [Mycobacteroides abscessus subsp. abscessus]